MRIETFTPRPHALEQAEAHGFTFHTIDGEPYWHEERAYVFSLAEIERELEAPSNELGEMCYALVEEALQREEWLHLLRIPRHYWDWIRHSWDADEPTLYGRFDLAYSGQGPAKLLEFNADTPTSLYESAVFQWLWLEELIQTGRLPARADQFNSIEERLRAGIPELGITGLMHLAAVTESDEDTGTVRYLEGLFRQCGLATELLDISEIGIDAAGRFTDLQDRVIDHLFKLYPWEMMVREEFGAYLPASGTRFWEPPWKMLLSNKGILPLLWRMYPGHRHLLEAYFDTEPAAARLGSRYVRKPIFSREGANVTLVDGDQVLRIPGDYGAEGHVVQAYSPLGEFDGWTAVIGAWMIRGEAAGIGIREDRGPITTNRSRFVPHYLLD